MNEKNIDLTARISGSAEIHESAKIGPYVIVDDNVKIGPRTEISPFTHIYPGAQIGPENIIKDHVVIGSNVYLGEGNRLEPGVYIRRAKIGDLNFFDNKSSIGGRPQLGVSETDRGLENVVIGNGNVVGEFVTINSGTEGKKTQVGNRNGIFAYTHIAHGCQIGNYAIFVNRVDLAGNVTVGDYAWLSAGVGVSQFNRIGRFAGIGARTAVEKDVPPFTFVDSKKEGRPFIFYLNKVAAHRGEVPQQIRDNVKNFYNVLFKEDDEKEGGIFGFIKKLLKFKGESIPTLTEKFRQLEEQIGSAETWEIAEFINEAFTKGNGIYIPHKKKLIWYNPASASNDPSKYHSKKEEAEQSKLEEAETLLKEDQS